jgi:transposase
MILLSADSHGVGEIARLTLFDENSVLFWFDRYEAEGLDGLDASVALNLGGPPKADGSYRSALQETVEQEPRAIGQRFSTWTCADLAHYLAQQGRVLLSAETVRRHMLDLGYRIIRPVLSIASPDPDYDVKAESLEQLKEQARRGEITLLFEDEVDLNLIERLWKHLRRKVTHNHLFDCIADLVAAVEQFLTDLNDHRAEVLSVIGNPQ